MPCKQYQYQRKSNFSIIYGIYIACFWIRKHNFHVRIAKFRGKLCGEESRREWEEASQSILVGHMQDEHSHFADLAATCIFQIIPTNNLKLIEFVRFFFSSGIFGFLVNTPWVQIHFLSDSLPHSLAHIPWINKQIVTRWIWRWFCMGRMLIEWLALLYPESYGDTYFKWEYSDFVM